MAAAAALAAWMFLAADGPSWTSGAVIGALAIGKAVAARLNKPRRIARTKHITVAVVMPFYDEEDASVRATLESILAQSRIPDELIIVNDGSATGDGGVQTLLPALRAAIPSVSYELFPANRGKRAALAAAIRMSRSDVVVTTDSDTILEDDALEQLIKPLARTQVAAVTGRVLVANRNANILTRIQDVLYGAAFLNERAALSLFGKVTICSGAISAYRRSVLVPHLDEFLARPRMFGEDRQLTSFALLSGRVLIQETARAWTRVPETVSHYVRQQLRWYRGDIQNSVWIARNAPLDSALFWLTFFYFTVAVSFVALLVLAVTTFAAAQHRQIVFDAYLLYAALISWVTLARYLEPDPGAGTAERGLALVVAPIAGLVYSLLLSPVRIYGLATFNSRGWGSRRREASLTGDKPFS